MKPKIYLLIIAVIILFFTVYFLFLKGDSEIEKVIKSLNAQNYEMAVAKLKELLYEDEENNEAKALLLYAQVRKTFDEEGVKTFKKALNIALPNLIKIRNLIYQNKLNEVGYLNKKDKEQFLRDSKDYRQQLAKHGITTQDMNELEELLKNLCQIGVSNLKLSQGDEVDQTLYAILLAGNSFFGNKESGTNLLKLAKLNEDAVPLFVFCGEEFNNDLQKELENDETLFGDIAKHLVIKFLVQNEIKKLFNEYPKMQSAKDNLSETNYSLSSYLYVDYKNNQIFYDKNIFSSYLDILEQNSKAGIDVKVNLYENNNIVCLYFYDIKGKRYVSKFYSFLDNNLTSIDFNETGSTKKEFFNEKSSVRFASYNKENSQITIVTDKVIKKTGYRSEQRWNPQKYYSSYNRLYQGGYDYVNVPYEYDDISNSGKIYLLNKDKADFVSEYGNTNETSEDKFMGD